jgi:hypothetical protein
MDLFLRLELFTRADNLELQKEIKMSTVNYNFNYNYNSTLTCTKSIFDFVWEKNSNQIWSDFQNFQILSMMIYGIYFRRPFLPKVQPSCLNLAKVVEIIVFFRENFINFLAKIKISSFFEMFSLRTNLRIWKISEWGEVT